MDDTNILYRNLVTNQTCKKCHRALSKAYVVKSQDQLFYYGSECIKVLEKDTRAIPDLTKRVLIPAGEPVQSSRLGKTSTSIPKDKNYEDAVSYLFLRQVILRDFRGLCFPAFETYLNEYYTTGTLQEASIKHINNLANKVVNNNRPDLSLINLLDCNICMNGMNKVIDKSQGKRKELFESYMKYLKRGLGITESQKRVVDEVFQERGIERLRDDAFSWMKAYRKPESE